VGKKIKELIQEELGKLRKPRDRAPVNKKRSKKSRADRERSAATFNKSHSVAYSILSYQTAWFKAYYPAEFMAALCSSEIGNTDRVVQYINEARELDLQVLAPDVTSRATSSRCR